MVEGEVIMNKNSPQNVESPSDSFVKVRRGKVESVDLYEIKDSELDVLEQGTPATLQLNFAIFLFSTAFTSIGALATATFVNDIIRNTFLFVSIAGILLGVYLFIAWLTNKKSAKIVIKRIRERIVTETKDLYNKNTVLQNAQDEHDDMPR